METLFSRHRNTVALIAALFVQLALLAWQVRRPDSDVPLLRAWMQAVVSPPQRIVSATLRGVGQVWENYVDLLQARQDNLRLETELDRQRLLNHQLRDQAQELERLRALVSFREKTPGSTITARVIGSGVSETSRIVILNKGREDGLKPNIAVITPDGIAGKVQRVFRSTAQVLLITDGESGAGALLEQSRIHGVLKGTNGAQCRLLYVLNDEKVEPGERVLTSGEDRVYPKGLPIGVVTQVRPGSAFKEITVQPAARLNRLEEVLVVIQGEEAPPPAAATPPAPEIVIPFAPPPLPVAGDNERPGIPRGARPETDADKVLGAYRQRAAQDAQKAAPKAKPVGPPDE